jgi:hypothetical protein
VNGGRSGWKALLVLLALAASLGLWFALEGWPEPAAEGPGPARPQAEKGARGDEGAELAAVDSNAARKEPVDLASGPTTARDGGLRIHFRVRAEDGEWNDAEDGRAGVIWDKSQTRGRWTVDITSGVGVLPPKEQGQPARRQLEFELVRLGGKRARVLVQPVPYPEGPELTVDCEYLRGTDLVVFDGSGRVQASGLQLVMAAGPNEWNLAVPIHWMPTGPTKTLGLELASPIALANQDGTTIYFVRSKRSAWSRIAIDHDTPGTRYVHLRPGGRVEFSVHANTLRPETALRMYEVGPGPLGSTEASALSTLTRDGHAVVDGLRAGRWEVRAELGTAPYGNPSLGAQQFEVTPGGVTQVTLNLQDPPAAHERVSVRGEIVSSEPIDRERFRSQPKFLELAAADPWSPDYGEPKRIPLLGMQPDPADPDKLSWDAGKLTPGPWSARLRTFQYSAMWTVEPERDNDFTIDLADLKTLVVRVLERESRAPVPLEELRFLRVGEPDSWTDSISFTADDPPGRAVLQAVEGPYRLELAAQGIEWGRAQRMTLEIPSLAVGDGTLEVEFSSALPSMLSVQVRSRDVNVPLPMAWWNQVEFWRPSGERLAPFRFERGGSDGSPDVAQGAFYFTDDGMLEVRFPATEEFLALPPATVQLAAAEASLLALELEPLL